MAIFWDSGRSACKCNPDASSAPWRAAYFPSFRAWLAERGVNTFSRRDDRVRSLELRRPARFPGRAQILSFDFPTRMIRYLFSIIA
jgi:hypothetical protein